MTELNRYLGKHFLNEVQLASASAMHIDELDALIHDRLLPAPSYVVTNAGNVCSFVFGEMSAPGSTPGRYFPPSQLAWIDRARRAIAAGATADIEASLKAQFTVNFATALATLNLSTWRLRDSFGDDGAPIAGGLRVRTDAAWEYFLNGTFGLCVANPISEAHIAYKEVLQEKLTQISDNGSQTVFSPQQAQATHELIDAYAAASMPFSPIEYASSSRKRLVEDLRANLRASAAAA
ncbi:DUF6058 family natural product biosynthesis protein [Janthinobacterium sp. PSPC3-1]|uniref:DUF6058 family natural product biosynthesis protein n=1 Tax=Janthinobacterium sp. PSPC3-1 TaxID=2804653 RepID=UPI003CEEE394